MKNLKFVSLSKQSIAFIGFLAVTIPIAFGGQAKALDTLSVDGVTALGSSNSLSRIHGQPRASAFSHDVYDRNQQISRKKQPDGSYLLRQVSTNKCFNAYRPAVGSPVNVWNCDSNDGDQKFAMEDVGGDKVRIRRKGTNLCVDSPTRSNGGKIHLWTCDSNNTNQRWKITPIINNPTASLPSIITMTSRANNLAVDAGGSNNNDIYGNSNVDAGNRWLQWKTRKVGNYYLFENVATGRALDAGGNSGNLVYPHPHPNASNDYHLWRVEQVGSAYMVISKATGKALDSGGQGGDIYMHPRPMSGNSYHQWKLQGVDGSNTGSARTFTMNEYYRQLYVSGGGTSSRGPHQHNNAIDSTARGSNAVKALVGGRVVSVRRGTQLSNVNAYSNRGYHPSRGWVKASDYNGTIVIYNSELNRTFTYLHFSGVNVTSGQQVNPGDVIGTEGSTGWSTGKHMHVHVQIGTNGSRENPLVTLGSARSRGLN